MKVLFITQFLPFPPDTGGKIKTYQTIKIVSKENQIFLISFVERKQDLKWEKEIRKHCYGTKTFVTPIITTSHKELKLRALSGIFNPKPFRVQKYFLREVADFIEKLSKKENFDAIHCDHETSIQYLTFVRNWQKKLKIYDEHNISSEGLFGYARYEKNPLEKLAYFIEGAKLWFYERRMIPVFDRILTISQADKEKLVEQGISHTKIKFLPIPFEAESQFHYGSKNILFIGLLSWWPNKDAVLWFYQRIFPLVKKKVPQAKFLVVGTNPPEEIKKIDEQDGSVEVTGHVKDVSPYFKKTGVFVVPIRAGAGVRVKILDALASGLPIVSTRMAAEGIRIKDKEEILIEDEEEKFVKAVMKLLKDRGLAKKLSLNGIKFIKENYNQEKTQKVLEQIYSEKGK
ncbi:glycosyltransferase family 4 protein [Patescibacteria group bacterium]|nr:glycosyltransferase family 4 protein [Patescibacteria group bacterium]